MAKSGKQDIPGCRNPEFASWLWEWYKEAQEADSRFLFALRKAFDSMVKCEERLGSGREAAKLSGIGPGISERLERRLQQHVADGNPWHCTVAEGEVQARPEGRAKRTSTKQHYVPKFRSVGYGVLLALLQHSGLTKSELVRLSQPYTNIVVTDSSVHRILALLIKKELVAHSRAMSSYQLTGVGQSMAERLWAASGREQVASGAGVQGDDDDDGTTAAGPDDDFSIEQWSKDDFEVVLLVDTREVKSRGERDAILKGLEDLCVPAVQTPLVLGDMTFVARHRSTAEDIILDMLVERKTDSDFVASIPDGRFKEQKFRLRSCGLQNIVYLLEGPGEGPNVTNFGEDKYFAAVAQTMFSDGFYIKRCGSVNETVHFLSDAYKHVVDVYGDGVAVFRASEEHTSSCLDSFKREREGCARLCLPLQLFNGFSAKSLNLSYFDIFVQQLMCIPGMSVEKAVRAAEQAGGYTAFLDALERDPRALPKGTAGLLNANDGL